MAVVAIAHSPRSEPDELARLLGADGYDVVSVPVRRSLIERLAEFGPDVVVVDGSCGDYDVMRLCRDLRRSTFARIVVVPETAADEAWVMEALNAGADDVLEQHASEAMLRTRMMAMVRRGPLGERSPERLVVGDVIVDLDGHCVLVGGDVVRFPVRLFRTLVELARRPNSVVTSDQLLHDVWGVDPLPLHRRRVRVAVSSLRRLLGNGVERPQIETVVRVGYRLVTPSVAESAA